MDSSTTSSKYGERGAGGKFRKPPARKPPSTPYDRPRPPPNAIQADANARGWLSKLVDPAYRLLSGGATRILPSFFSKSPSTVTTNTDIPENLEPEVAPTMRDEGKGASSRVVFTSSERASPSEVPERLNRTSEFDELRTDIVKVSSDNIEISRIEQLIKGKTFSRDEVNHLMDILNSRTHDVSGFEQGKNQVTTNTAGGNIGTSLTGKEVQEDNNIAILGTPLPQIKEGVEIGASPIDIARAYMGSRNLEQGPGPYNDLSKAEGTMQLSLVPSPSPKASTCWPGSSLPDQRGYATPLSQKGRYGLHEFPRTPYSRAMYSKSRAKPIQSQTDSRFRNSSSNIFQQSRTPIFGQARTRDDVQDNGYGSVGPIRHIRSRFASEVRPRGSIFSNKSVETLNVPKGFLPSVEKNLELGETSNSLKKQLADSGAHRSEEDNSLLNPSTSQAVKRILDHLDRNKPTPKEKAAELKLATAWRRPASSETSDDLARATNSLSHGGDRKSDLVSEGNDGRMYSHDLVRSPQLFINGAKNAIDAPGSLSILDGDSGMKNHVSAESSSRFKGISNSQVQSNEKSFLGISNGQKGTSEHRPVRDQSNGQNLFSTKTSGFNKLLKNPATQSSATKPILPAIAISKPDPARIVSSDNGFGFTFPVTASLGVLSEPPTPSIMPSSSPSLPSSQTQVSASMLSSPTQSAVPAYSFGSKTSSDRLVFSFPATSSAPPSDGEASDLKFNFGSDKNTRLSFKTTGKGAVCF